MTAHPDLTPEQQAADRRRRMLDAVRIAADRVEKGMAVSTPEQASDPTDEELAKIKDNTYLGIPLNPVRTRHLIVALQTERAENERLRRITDAWGALEFSSRWAGPGSRE